MADNVVANAGSGGATFASDDIGGVQYPIAKLAWGPLDTANLVDTASGKPMPVQLRLNAGTVLGDATTPVQVSVANTGANATAIKVDNSAVTQPVSNAGTFAVQVSSIAAGSNAIGKLATNSGVNIGNIGQVLQVTPGTTASDLGKAEDAAHASGDTGVMMLAVRKDTAAALATTDGDYIPLTTDATGYLYVTVGGSALPTGAATSAKQDTIIGYVDGVETLLSSIDATQTGVAHDAADAGNPFKVGAKATTSLSALTMVASADRTNLFAGVDGVLITRPNCNLEDVVQERTTNTDGASTAFASGLAAPGAGIRLWVKSVTISNSSASFCTVDLRDGAAGSVLWTFPVPATGGVTHNFDPPLRLTANTALAFDASAATTTLTIAVNGFKSKV